MITAPKIHTDLLWGLTGVFVFLAFLYFGSVFYFRNKISKETKRIREKKKELSPMISEFLFYDEKGDKIEKINYIDLKIEIRDLIKHSFDRKVLTEIILDLRKDVSGNTRNELFHIYQDLGLHEDAYKKLKSWRWEIISKGIFELTQMNVMESYSVITKFINDKRPTIRKQAEIAAVTLKEEGISYFLDHTRFKISEWQQLKLLDVIRNKEDFSPPQFRLWLTSKNNHVVLFALRLIKFYNQNDAKASLVELVKHKNNHIKNETINCIKEFNITQAIPVLKMVFWKCNVDVRMNILDALSELGSKEEISFLNEVKDGEATFTVRSKAISAINTISPEDILPTQDIVSNEDWETPEEITVPAENSTIIDAMEPNAIENADNTENTPIETPESTKEPGNKSIAVEMDADDISFLPLVANGSRDDTVLEDEESTGIDEYLNCIPLSEMDVISEVIYPDVQELLANEIELPPENIAFLPLIKNEDAAENILNIKKMDVVYENVIMGHEPISLLNFDFLPKVVDETKRNNSSALEEIPVIFEEVQFKREKSAETIENLEVSYELIIADKKDIITRKTHDNNDMLNEIKEVEIENIEVVWEQIHGTDFSELKAIDDIDWSAAFNGTEISKPNTSELEVPEVSPQLSFDEIEKTKNESQEYSIPEPVFYADDVLDTMTLLEDIDTLGDYREIPYLKLLQQQKTAPLVQARIEELIHKFSNEYLVDDTFELTAPETSISVFNELVDKIDTESKLILIKEIAKVGDEKEVPLLNSLLKEDNEEIVKQTQAALKVLHKRLLEETNKELSEIALDSCIQEIIENDTALYTEKEDMNSDLNFELNEPGSQIESLSNNQTKGTLFDHLCAASTKLYDKFNG